LSPPFLVLIFIACILLTGAQFRYFFKFFKLKIDVNGDEMVICHSNLQWCHLFTQPI